MRWVDEQAAAHERRIAELEMSLRRSQERERQARHRADLLEASQREVWRAIFAPRHDRKDA
jgi:hypothetical protein